MTVIRRKDSWQEPKAYLEIAFQGQPQQKFYLFRITWHFCRMLKDVQLEEQVDEMNHKALQKLDARRQPVAAVRSWQPEFHSSRQPEYFNSRQPEYASTGCN